jgi:hypothetical protein
MARRRQQFNGSLSTNTNNVLSQDSISNNNNDGDGDVGGSTVGGLGGGTGAGAGPGGNGRQMHGNVRSTVVPRLTTDPLHTNSNSNSDQVGNNTMAGPTAVVLEKKPHVPRGTEGRAYPPAAAAAANDYGGHHELHQHRGGGSQNQGQGRSQAPGQNKGQGRSRGKGKDGPPHPHKLNNSARTLTEDQHHVEGRANEAEGEQNAEDEPNDEEEQNAEEENEEEEEDEESCFICAEKIKYYSGGVCGHKTCQ